MPGKRVVGGMIALVMSVLVHQGLVWGHAKFLRADPAPGSTVKTAPQVIRVWFTLAAANEELDPKRSILSVWDTNGKRVDNGRGGVDLNDLDHKSMIARIRPLPPGMYTVRWKAVSTPDLEVTQGTFLFTVASPKSESVPREPETL